MPPEAWVVDWWSDDLAPGTGTGTVVLDTHLDSHQYATGPFARATDLAAGDPTTIQDDAGGAHEYRVSEVLTCQHTALPVEDLICQTGPERVVPRHLRRHLPSRAGGWGSSVIVVLDPRSAGCWLCHLGQTHDSEPPGNARLSACY